MSARALFVLLVMIATLMTPREAFAQAAAPTNPAQLPQRQATFTWVKPTKGPDNLTASFSFVDVLDPAMQNKLSNGLSHNVVMRAYLWREGDSDPVALAARTCKIAFDLWDDVYKLTISGPGGDRSTASPNLKGVLRLCFEAQGLQITDRSLTTPNRPHFLGVIVEVNPVNAQMVEQMRKWVTRPAGSTGIGPGDALFGSFVGLFVRDIGKSERTLTFRTQPFTP